MTGFVDQSDGRRLQRERQSSDILVAHLDVIPILEYSFIDCETNHDEAKVDALVSLLSQSLNTGLIIA